MTGLILHTGQQTSLANARKTDSGQPVHKIHIVWFYPGSIFLSFDLMRAETDRLFREIAVSTTWDRGPSVNNESTAVDIHVILIDTLRRVAGVNDDLIGYVHVSTQSDGTPRNTIHIYLPNVLRTLGFHYRRDRVAVPLNVRLKLNQPKARRDLATALGRIIAHEVVHIVTPEVPHSSHGLMVPVYKRCILTHPEMHFPPQYAELFRTKLRAAIAEKTKTLLLVETNTSR
jgi:hypothetical protein